jgi:Xaa-Pro aminopeptidase
MMEGRLHVYYEEQVDFEQIRKSFVARYQELMEKHDLEGILVTRIENVQSVTRWRAPFGRYHYVQRYGALLNRKGDVAFLTRPGDTFKAEAVMPWLKDVRVVPDMTHGGEKGGWEEAVRTSCLDYGIKKRLGADLMTLKLFYSLQKSMPSLEIVDLDSIIMQMRMIKTEDEIKVMRMAVEVAEKGLEAGLEVAKPGIRECEVSARIAEVILKEDSEGVHLTPHVITGPHSGLKYRHHTDRRIRFGDIIRIDCGTVYAGYVGEYNRTTIAGRPSPKQRELAQVVYEAHTSCMEAIKPGVAAKEIDSIARKVIEKRGYGKYQHRHPTGHGLGLDIHELPTINEGQDTVLKPGMVMCIEPGIWYFDDPEVGGIVFEDVLLITKDKHEILTRTEYCSRLLGFDACPMGKY